MPKIPFNPADAGANLNLTPGQGTLNLSGNASATAYTVWTEKTQNLTGWWERKWDFAPDPLVPSSCGNVVGTYILYHMQEVVNTQHTTQTFASGLTVLHNLDYLTNSVSGGWGTSGYLYTASAGYTRVSGAVGASGHCVKHWDATGMYQQGEYTLDGAGGDMAGGTDTSSYWNSTFNQNINYSDCVKACKDWQPGIVII